MNQILHFINTHPYLVLLFSFTIGYLFMPVVIEVARKYNFVVSPNKRTSHNGHIPNIGGINIFVSFLFTVFLFSYNVRTAIYTFELILNRNRNLCDHNYNLLGEY